MHLLNPFRRYSDFLKSGFHAFTKRVHKQPSKTSPHAMLDTPYLTPKTSFSDTTTERRPRAVSMPNTPRDKVERRRSSPTLSSNLFDHNSTPNFFNDTSTIYLRRSSTCSVESGESEVWIARSGLYTVPAINDSSDEGSCDPFSSASDAKSVFLETLQDDHSVLGTLKHGSFLSFTTPSSNRSSLLFCRERTSN